MRRSEDGLHVYYSPKERLILLVVVAALSGLDWTLTAVLGTPTVSGHGWRGIVLLVLELPIFGGIVYCLCGGLFGGVSAD